LYLLCLKQFFLGAAKFGGQKNLSGHCPRNPPVARGLKCRLPNRISFDVFDRCFCKFDTRACETLRSCPMRLGGLAVTTLPGASRSFNPALVFSAHLIGFMLRATKLERKSALKRLRYCVSQDAQGIVYSASERK